MRRATRSRSRRGRDESAGSARGAGPGRVHAPRAAALARAHRGRHGDGLPFLHLAKRLWERAEREREARRALDGAVAWIARDLRQAGYHVPGPALRSIGGSGLSYTLSRDGEDAGGHPASGRRLVTVFAEGGDLKCRVQAARLPVIPYFGYARQDRKDQPRVPISAKLIADLISTAGTDRVLTMDLHAGQIQGFFNVPVDHLYALPVLLVYITKKKLSDLVVVSPDAGGVERARAFAKRLQANLAIIDKRREGPNQTQIMNIIGDVQGKCVLLLDDMIDTAGTIVQGAQACADKGARVRIEVMLAKCLAQHSDIKDQQHPHQIAIGAR